MNLDFDYILAEHRALPSWEVAKHFYHFGWYLARQEREQHKPLIGVNFDALVLDELERAAYDLCHSLLWTETRQTALLAAHDGYNRYRFG